MKKELHLIIGKVKTTMICSALYPGNGDKA